MKKYLILLVVLFCSTLLSAQAGSWEARFYKAYVSSGLSSLKALIQDMEAEYRKNPSPAAQLALAKARYAAVGACFAYADESSAKQLLSEANKTNKALLSESPSAEAHALQAGILGMKIGVSPMKGILLGPQASKHAAQAMALQPENPFVRLQHSLNLFYTPAAYGGSVKKAIEGLQAASSTYEAQGTANNWEYLLCLASLGQALQSDGQLAAARQAYQKALAVAPNFGWVKYQLLPELEKTASR